MYETRLLSSHYPLCLLFVVHKKSFRIFPNLWRALSLHFEFKKLQYLHFFKMESRQPLLKYQRLGQHIRTILSEDSASALALYHNFLVLGTYAGHVHLLTLSGTHTQRLHSHVQKVNDISIDATGKVLHNLYIVILQFFYTNI